eukprot:g38573.t1
MRYRGTAHSKKYCVLMDFLFRTMAEVYRYVPAPLQPEVLRMRTQHQPAQKGKVLQLGKPAAVPEPTQAPKILAVKTPQQCLYTRPQLGQAKTTQAATTTKATQPATATTATVQDDAASTAEEQNTTGDGGGPVEEEEDTNETQAKADTTETQAEDELSKIPRFITR